MSRQRLLSITAGLCRQTPRGKQVGLPASQGPILLSLKWPLVATSVPLALPAVTVLSSRGVQPPEPMMHSLQFQNNMLKKSRANFPNAIFSPQIFLFPPKFSNDHFLVVYY